MKFQPGTDSTSSPAASSGQSAEHYLPLLSGGMRAELIGKRSVMVCGLGSFILRHYPARRRSGKGGMEYLPPGNRVVFEAGTVSRQVFTELMLSRLPIDRAEAERLSDIFPAFFRSRLHENGAIVFPGFGRIFTENGQSRFEPDTALEDLLNSEYRNMGPIALSYSEPEMPFWKMLLVPAAAMVVLVLVTAGLLFLSGRRNPLPDAATALQQAPLRHSPDREPSLPDNSLTKRAGTPAPETGVLLEKGEYTVVLATFLSKRTAEKELAGYTVPGTRVFIWPVTGRGKNYYRLAAGRFAGSGEALAWKDSTDFGRFRDIYIQQANRRVVLHGEEGL